MILNKSKCILILVTVFFFFVSCGKKPISKYPPPITSNIYESKLDSERMLIWYASMTLQVNKIEYASNRIESIVKTNKGYIENNNFSLPENANFEIRVPSNELQPTLSELSKLGVEKNRFISSKDVTEEYIDTEARLENAISLRNRLKQLLNNAENVSDILQIEKELTRIQSEIDSMEGLIKTLGNNVDYAIITIQLELKTILGPLGYIAKGIGWVIKKLFIIR